jgi:hypothetical protein
MSQRPVARGLFVCEQVIVEERTHNVSLINCFTMRSVATFPTPPQPFVICALLTSGHGTIQLGVVISRLTDLGVIYRQTMPQTFDDPLQEVRFYLRVSTCSFPEPGWYEVVLLADGEPVAQTRLQIARRGA